MLAAHTRGREAGGEVAAEAAGGTGGTLMNAPPSCAASFGGEAEREQGSPFDAAAMLVGSRGWLGTRVSPTPGAVRAHLGLLEVPDVCADPMGCVGTGGGPQSPHVETHQEPSSAPVPGRGPNRAGFLLPQKTTAAQHHLPLGSGPCGVSKGCQDGATKSLCVAGTHPMAPQGGGPAARGGHGGGDAG